MRVSFVKMHPLTRRNNFCKKNLEVHCLKRRRHKCLSRQSIAGQIVAAWYMYIHMRSSSGLFHVHINAKSVNQFPAGKRKFTPPSFGKECKRQCREDAAVKL